MEALRKQAARILQEKKKHKLWLTVFLCMAALVTAGTVTALKMSGQALSHKEKVLTCGIEVHQHTEQCHDSEGNLVCGQADYVVHVHNDDCRDKDGNLVCTLPEIEPHEHEDSCFAEEKNLICTQKESAGHQHDENCYTKVQGELICGMEGTGHQHGAECYTKVQGELICASEEEGHEHTDECYEWIEELTCGQTEEVHEHTDECYKWTEELNCEILEGEGAHTHTDECYETETVNTCGKLELHTHEDSCYDEDGNLICGQTELLEHVHADGCFEIIEIEVSDQESGASEESGEEDAGTEEAGEESGEPEADGEDEETQLFHKTYEDAEIRVVAEYDESANIPEEAQLVAERIEAGAEGDAQDDMETADPKADDAQDNPETADPELDDAQGIDSADETQEPQETDAEADEQIPVENEAGDEAGSESEEGGIEPLVDEVTEPTEVGSQPEGADSADSAEIADTEPAESVETATEEVSYRLKFLVDGKEVEPESTVTFTVWNPEGEDSEPQTIVYSAGDGSDAMVVTLTKTVTAVVEPELQKVYEDDSIRVVAKYNASANIPAEAEFTVEQITDSEHFAECEAELQEHLGDEKATMDMLLKIGFYVDSKEIEPEDTVEITIQFLDKDRVAIGAPMNVIHFAKDKTEVLNGSDVDENGATTFQTDSFSDFGLRFTQVAASSDGTGIFGLFTSDAPTFRSVYVYGDGEWNEIKDGFDGFTYRGDKFDFNSEGKLYITTDAFANIVGLDDYSSKLNNIAVGDKWIAYSLDGKTITTAEIIEVEVGTGWTRKVWLFEGITAENYLSISGFYYLPDNKTSYVNKNIDEINTNLNHEFILNPGNGNGVESLPQYGNLDRVVVGIPEERIHAQDGSNERKYATITLPSDADLGNPDFKANGVDSVGGNGVPRTSSGYDFKLVGWYNIADGKEGTYYNVENGSREVTIDLTKQNVFYADWVHPTYDFATSGEKPVTEKDEEANEYITTRVFDFNELFNIYSAKLEQGKNAAGWFEKWSDGTGEGYGFQNGTNSMLFIAGTNSTEGDNFTSGALAKPINIDERNSCRDYLITGSDGWNIGPTSSYPFELLFSENSEALGVHFIGYGFDLYRHYYYKDKNSETNIGYYKYNSNEDAASYQKSEGKFYVYDNTQSLSGNSAFLPFNTNADFTTGSGLVNYHFGMSTEIDFYLPAGVGSAVDGKYGNMIDDQQMEFKFSGDDDLWVFLDGELVLDMGGIHGKKDGSINFSTGDVIANGKRSNFTAGQGDHTLTVYYMERGAGLSNCSIEFNLVPFYKIVKPDANTVTVTKEWNDVGNSFNHANDSVQVSLGNYIDDGSGSKVWETAEGRNDATVTLNEANNWSHAWVGLSPDSNYEVIEDPVPEGYVSSSRLSGDSTYKCWAETDSLGEKDSSEEKNVIVILNSSGDKALNKDLDATDIVYANGVICSDLTDDVKWEVQSHDGGYSLQNLGNGKYLGVSGNTLTFSDTPSAFKLDKDVKRRLCIGDARILYENGAFCVGPINGNDTDNETSEKICVRVFRNQKIRTRVKNFTIKNTYIPAVTIDKVDSENLDEKLAGSEFRLTRSYQQEIEGKPGTFETKYSYCDKGVWKDISKDKLESDDVKKATIIIPQNGLRLDDFRDGIYTLTEVKEPSGYEKLEGPSATITFEVKDGKIDESSIQCGEIDFVENTEDTGETETRNKKIAQVKTGSKGLILLVRNKAIPVRNAKAVFVKYSQPNGMGNANKLDGAKFTLYRSLTEEEAKTGNGIDISGINEKVLEVATDLVSEEGIFYTGDLLCRTNYYLKEVEPPEGYNVLAAIIKIEVDEDGKVSSSVDESIVKVVEPKVSEENSAYEIKVFNTYGFELPETGSTGTQPYTIGGAALATVAVFLMYGYSMRRKKSERRSRQ